MVEQQSAILVSLVIGPWCMTGIQLSADDQTGAGSNDGRQVVFKLCTQFIAISALSRTVDSDEPDILRR